MTTTDPVRRTSALGHAPLSRRVLGPENGAVPFEHPFRAEFASWLDCHAPTEPEPAHEDERFAHRRAWQATMHAGGWAGLTWPAEYGGRGEGPLVQLMAYEELALHRAPEPANTPGMILLGPTLMLLGTDELKERFLPRILSGADLYCQGFSEPDSGSDLASLRTRARRDRSTGDWAIDGQKIWTTFADRADYCFVLARTDPDSRRHRGLTLLICPMDQPRVSVRPIRQISGDREFSEVFFDDARVPAGWVVGEPGAGWHAAMTLFQFERGDPGYTDHARLLVELADIRTTLAAAALSPAAAADIRARATSLWLRCQELRALNVRLAVLAEQGRPIAETGSVTNLVWGELAKDVADLNGDVADLAGRDVAAAIHHRLACRAKSIYSGTTEIQRTIIAERLLGLPR
ncbi:acyl-CoA dehydrogenase family protein [Saccharomonospora sp. NPDC046836]|uniref:acyl-CoA dehydrogenase family protein n=1 Tax=Saccharomonospora sp. NPDC046836 TaxID=3156921 RepID=UPI00340D40F4